VRSELPKPTIFSWFERMISHIGTETRPELQRGGCSEEYWTMH